MSDRNWEKELAKIDKQIASYSDDDLVARKSAAPPASASAPAVSQQRDAAPVSATPGRWGVVFRVGLAVALAVAVPFWPYASRCGLWFMGYLASVAVVIAAGVWAATVTWRARAGRLHVASLFVAVWGATLAAREVLPRVRYTKDAARSAWVCQ